MMKLTEKQKECLIYVVDNPNPSVREVGDYFAISCRAAQDRITACIGKGVLIRAEGKARTLEATDHGLSILNIKLTPQDKVPLYGRLDKPSKPLRMVEVPEADGCGIIEFAFIMPDHSLSTLHIFGGDHVWVGPEKDIAVGDLRLIVTPSGGRVLRFLRFTKQWIAHSKDSAKPVLEKDIEHKAKMVTREVDEG